MREIIVEEYNPEWKNEYKKANFKSQFPKNAKHFEIGSIDFLKG